MATRKYDTASFTENNLTEKDAKKANFCSPWKGVVFAIVCILSLALIVGLIVYFTVVSKTRDNPKLVADIKVEVVRKNATSGTGEGPHWDGETQSLMYVDIFNNNVHRWNSLTGEDTKWHFDEPVSLVIPNRNGGYIISIKKKLVLLNWDTGNFTVLNEVEKNIDGNRFNDGKCDPSGRLWAGTMAWPDWFKGALYRMDIDGSIHTMLTNISISNGLAWSSDGKTMYYVDSKPKKVFAFDYDTTSGIISKQRVIVDINLINITDPNKQPDGMTIDTEDKIWVAIYGDAKVIRFDPATGTPLTTVKFPTKATSSCTFGGKNLDELYVTSAGKSSLEDPFAGSVFKVTGLGVKGRPAFVYNGHMGLNI